jgi:pimeloyl-ACP methyl ester carboxylesterase
VNLPAWLKPALTPFAARPAFLEKPSAWMRIRISAQRYPSIRCPVRIFHGTADQLIEPEQARHLHRALRGSVLHLVEDAGHMVTYADGAAIAEAVNTVVGANSIRPIQN